MLFYKVKVFKEDWLAIIKDTETNESYVIVNNLEKLINIYKKNITNLWCGYNSRIYDQWILKGLIIGLNPKEISHHIIIKDMSGFSFSTNMRKVKLYNYDIKTSNHSLKQLEGFMGNDIYETKVNSNLERKLTLDEINEVVNYCMYHVEETIKVFLSRYEDFQSHLSLLKTFNLPLKFISKTKPQLSSIILDARRKHRADEFNITIVPTLRLSKYRYIVNWYKNPLNLDYKKSLEADISGILHNFGFGGLHGAKNHFKDKGIFINSDVISFYPTIMIKYNFLSRNVLNPSKYKALRESRLYLKKNKNPMEKPYKIVLNATFGGSKDKYNSLYDPLMANNVCINGQLLLLDLIEHLEPHFTLIQSNTDGVIFKIPGKEYIPKYKTICKEWEKRTGMNLEHEIIKEIIQKDVNNYVVVYENGRIKSKGAYVKPLNPLDYDLPIVNKAIIDYLTKGIPAKDTINNCNSLKEFQRIVKISNKFQVFLYGKETLSEKVLRIFASKSDLDKELLRLKRSINNHGHIQYKEERIANIPRKCFIENKNINKIKVPSKLDKAWYIEIANKRICDFLGKNYNLVL